MSLDSLLKLAIDASIVAAKAVVREKHELKSWLKEDGSVVSEADLLSDELIALKLSASGYAILSEENLKDYTGGNDIFWLVDPIDGTKGFLKGSSSYCILIALIKAGRPILAVLNAPEKDLLFYAHNDSKLYKNGKIAHKKACKRFKNIALTGQHSKNQAELAFIKENNLKTCCIPSAVKIVKLLEGKACVYYKANGLSIWDIAVSDYLLEKSGGIMCDHQGNKLIYKDDQLISKPFIALADKAFFKDFKLH